MSQDYMTLHPDAKGRITIGKLTPEGTSSFRAYVDERQRIILEPYAEIPAREAWLYKNPEALQQVLEGLADSAAGRVSSLGSFASHADDDIE